MEKQADNLGWRDDLATGDENRQIQPASDGGHSDEFDILLCLRVLLSYWWILAPLAVLGSAAGIVFCVYTPPVYRATCRFEIFQNVKLKLGEDFRSSARNYESSIWRHILIMKSDRLNGKIKEKMDREFRGKIPHKFARFRTNIDPVKDAPGSMLDISVDSFSTDYSLSYLNKLIEGYQRKRLEETDLLTTNTLTNLRHELNNLSEKLENTQNDIAQFEAEHNIYFVREKSKSDQALLTSLMGRQSQLRTQLAILEAQFPILKGENAATLRDVLELTNQLNRLNLNGSVLNAGAADSPQSARPNNAGGGWSEIPEWRDNEALIMRLTAEYENLLETFKPAHPKMLELTEQINAAKRELEISAEISFKRLQSIRDALTMQEQALLKAAQSFRMEINLSAVERAEYEKLKAREEHLKGLHDQVFARIIDSSASSTDQYYSRYVDGPSIVPEPVWPVKWKIITLSVSGFTALGAGLILLSYFVKVRLYDYHALEQSLKLKCLAGIPRFKTRRFNKKRPLDSAIVLKDKNEFASECYRSLRTNIEQGMDKDDQVIMLTSPDPGEGKTFSVLNLAIVFSWNSKKVLIIDGDFRRMTFRKLFEHETNNGLTDCLTSETMTWRDCITPTDLPNIDYLPAGHMNQNITELLNLPRLGKIFTELRGEYDIILIDSAPVNRVVDTIVLAKHADNVVLIARAGKTKIHSLRYCYSRLGMANIIGYILNNIDAATKKYGYYSYGYSYYSTYHQYKTYYKSYYGDKKIKKEGDKA